jgi:ribosome modulation factor
MKRKTALDGAYLKGLMAGLADEPVESCPYEDKRKQSGRLTWSRAFRTAWGDGWKFARLNREQALITLQYSRSARRPSQGLEP